MAAGLALSIPVKDASVHSLKDVLAAAAPGQPFLRIMYVARLTARATSVLTLQSTMAGLLSEQSKGGDAFTGLMLVMPTCLVHMLEGPPKAVHAVLGAMVAAPPAASGLAEARLLLAMEGLPARAFASWAAAFVPSGSTLEAADPPAAHSQVIKAASEAAACLRHLGGSLAQLPEEEQQRHLSNLASFHEDLPGPEALLPLLAARDAAPALAEYLALMRGALDVDTDGELAWPAETSVCL